MATPALTYFQSATSSLRARATMVDLRRRPPVKPEGDRLPPVRRGRIAPRALYGAQPRRYPRGYAADSLNNNSNNFTHIQR